MGQEKPLINIDTSGLTEPGKLLIKKISNACGILYGPLGKVRQAKAEVEVKKIKALGDIELSEIEQRALKRILQEETIKQVNAENITRLALPQLEEDSNPEELDNDWVHNFFEKSKFISDEEMQSLWAKVLAGEANKPNSYSKRTVNLMANIDKSDAQLFTKFCSYVILFEEYYPLIYYENKDDLDIYLKRGVNFEGLEHLDDIGLISLDVNGYRCIDLDKKIKFFYYGKPIQIEFRKDRDNSFQTGIAILTKTGKELLSIAGSKSDHEFLEFLQTKWHKSGYVVSLINS